MTRPAASQAVAGPVSTPGLLLGALTVVIWAGFNVDAKFAIDAGFTPAQVSLLRFGVAGLVLIPMFVLGVGGRDRRPGLLRTLALSALGGPAFGALAVSGYHYVPLSHGMVFAPAAAFVSGTLLGALWLREPLHRRHYIGGAVVLAGLLVLSGFDVATLGPASLRGDLLFVATGTIWGGFTALMRRWQVDPIAGAVSVGALSGALSPLVFWVIGRGEPWPDVTPADFAVQALILGLLGGLAANFAYFFALRMLGAARASLLPCLTPGAALLIALAVLGDPIRLNEAAGVALVSAGLIVAVRRPRPPM